MKTNQTNTSDDQNTPEENMGRNKMTKRFGAIIQVCTNYSIDTGKVQARDIYCLGVRIYRQVIS